LPRGFADRAATGQCERIRHPAKAMDRRANVCLDEPVPSKSKDYEVLPENSEAVLYIAMIELMSKQLASRNI
jgi:hypothetical protein